MSNAHPTPFDPSFRTANTWLKELMELLQWHDKDLGYRALRVTLHSLRDRLTIEEVADLGAQLPVLIRGMYYEGWRPAAAHSKPRSREEFLKPIASAFRNDPQIFPEMVAWSVFRLLQTYVSAGEIHDIKHVLPREITALWPEGEVQQAR